jgi:hypothetical protein
MILYFERKIEIATDGLSHDCFNRFYERVAKLFKENAAIIADYVISMKTEINSSDYYRRDWHEKSKDRVLSGCQLSCLKGSWFSSIYA